MSSIELLKPLVSCPVMITRSDVDVSPRIANYGCNMIPSYLSASQEFPVESPEFPYHDDPFGCQPSLFEFSDSCNNNGKHLFESMVNSFITKNEHHNKSIYSEETFSTGARSKKLESHLHIANKLGKTRQINYPKDDLDTFDLFRGEDPTQGVKEECMLTYPSPVTPTEPLLEASESSNPLAQLEHISFDEMTYETQRDLPRCLTPPKNLFSSQSSYDTSSLMYGNDDMTMFNSLVNCNEVMRNHKSSQPYNQMSPTQEPIKEMFEPISPAESAPIEEECPKQADFEISQKEEQSQIDKVDVNPSLNASKSSLEENKKNKLTGLQRKALDSIFSITDRPSRGLVLHIATELCLHHITVKNFFSNGRRRLRRAAARLSDPERTRRENQRRKEKRRLAALAASASGAGGDKTSPLKRSLGEPNQDSQNQREPPVLSPERKALMEKLAVKVQRSVAQKGLQQAFMNYETQAKSFGTQSLTPPTQQAPPPQQQQTASDQVSPTLESILNSHIHSNGVSSHTEPAQTLSLMPGTEKAFLQESAPDCPVPDLFPYADTTERLNNYNHSCADQNLFANCLPQDQSNMNLQMEPEEAFSPTSWHALWNA